MTTRRHRSFACAFAALCWLCSARASAQVDLGTFGRILARQAKTSASLQTAHLPALFSRGRGGGVPVIVRAPALASAPELTAVGEFAVGELSFARLLELSQQHPSWRFDWAPPRHVLLDRIESWVHAQSVREQTQTSGKGVVVGIVDTGVDLSHGDLRTPAGKTRVAWWFDVSRSPQHLHEQLEAAYGCNVAPGCAVYAAADLEALVANDIVGDEPTDPFGHGTHVASLAAGNGLASTTPRYIGVAPEATFVVARVAQDNGGIHDADVLKAVKFVFDRARDLGMPAVVNLSLGSDFGAHDGSSALELGLSSMVGPDFPGRAIVVAAGNSAGLYDGLGGPYPGPFGVHTEVHVPRASVSRVPLLTPARTGNFVNGTAFVWLAFRAGDEVSVGVESKGSTLLAPLGVGQGSEADAGGYRVGVLNGIVEASDDSGISPGKQNAIVYIDGSFPADSDFAIHLEGHGSAQLWVQALGDLDPAVALGALFPRGEKEGTINVPASASALIAVGATLNRTTWTDAAGNAIEMPDLGSLERAPLDSIAYFSAAGPNALGAVKPDIVAPGVNVAGAMARSADPRHTDNDLFASMGRCPTNDECFVVDDEHAITSGTSMAAPLVSGAIALLFELEPTLTQDAARAVLQAGARPLQGIVIDPRQIGPGALDLSGALRVLSAGESPALRTPTEHSWLTLSGSFAHPDPDWLLTAFVDLRDDADQIADGFDPRRLTLSAEPALIQEGLTRVAPGFYRFALSAPPNSGGDELRVAVSFDGTVIASKTLRIAVDRWVASDGVRANGGCSVGTSSGARTESEWLGLLLLLGLCTRRYIRTKYAVHDCASNGS
ncbi:MAG TPA: S8 family serine peptidase [Polyangiaceae bacterium]|nr:S8 family serine peptidase [Polyangiaceae bacterium]